MNHWFLGHTKPNRERAVAVQLHQRGLLVYLPIVWVNPVNLRSAHERPYFPAYVFAQIDENLDCLQYVQWAPGIKRVVMCDGELLIVSDVFITELKDRLAQVRVIPADLPGEVRRGTGPLIDKGPFAGFDGIFNLRLPSNVRSQIMLACVQQEHWRLKALSNHNDSRSTRAQSD